MPVQKYKPTSPGRRSMTGYTFEEITRGKPYRSLLKDKRKRGGRNNKGRVTVRHRGGGNRRNYRLIDFKRDKANIPAKVESIEYDPNRSARIALVLYADGERRYIIAPLGLRVGDSIVSGPAVEMRLGNTLPIRAIPVGSLLHNVELQPGRGGQLARAAGTSAQLLAKEGTYAQVRLPSGEVRMIHENCLATVGQVGNTEHGNIKFGKAGRKRWLGWRPTVRGTAMDPNSHPHGGGEGRSPIGMSGPKTPWGQPALGMKTRRNKRSDKFILRRRGKRR